MIWCDNLYRFFSFRMDKSESLGMKHLPFYTIFSSSEAVFSLIAICFVSEYWTADGCHMYTDLVHTSCFEGYFEETIFIANICINSTVVSDCFLSSIVYTYFCFILSILYPQEFSSYTITGFRRFPHDKSMVYFFYLSGLEEDEERFESRFIFCYDDSTTGVSIDTVYERRTK